MESVEMKKKRIAEIVLLVALKMAKFEPIDTSDELIAEYDRLIKEIESDK